MRKFKQVHRKGGEKIIPVEVRKLIIANKEKSIKNEEIIETLKATLHNCLQNYGRCDIIKRVKIGSKRNTGRR